MFCMSLSVTCRCTFSAHCWPLQVGHTWSRHWYWMWDTGIWLSYGISQRRRKKNMHSIHGHYRLWELKILFQYGWVYIPNVIQHVKHVRFKLCSVHRTILNIPQKRIALICDCDAHEDVRLTTVGQTRVHPSGCPHRCTNMVGTQTDLPKIFSQMTTDLQIKTFLNQTGHSGFSSPWWAFLPWIYPAIFLADINI